MVIMEDVPARTLVSAMMVTLALIAAPSARLVTTGSLAAHPMSVPTLANLVIASAMAFVPSVLMVSREKVAIPHAPQDSMDTIALKLIHADPIVPVDSVLPATSATSALMVSRAGTARILVLPVTMVSSAPQLSSVV